MAIINFSFKKSEVPEDAQNLKATHRGAGYTGWIDGKLVELPGPTVLYTWETHIGLCLKDIEENGYNDSDFIMLVWNPEKQIAERICFASTRGWSYPAYNSYVDATPEVRAAYEAKCIEGQRRIRIERKLADRKNDQFIADRLNVRRKDVTRLRNCLGGKFAHYDIARNGNVKFTWNHYFESENQERYVRVLNLICRDQKNEFKNSLRRRVLEWIVDPEPKYASPLSYKQMQYI